MPRTTMMLACLLTTACSSKPDHQSSSPSQRPSEAQHQGLRSSTPTAASPPRTESSAVTEKRSRLEAARKNIHWRLMGYPDAPGIGGASSDVCTEKSLPGWPYACVQRDRSRTNTDDETEVCAAIAKSKRCTFSHGLVYCCPRDTFPDADLGF